MTWHLQRKLKPGRLLEFGAYSGPQPKAPSTVKVDPVPKARSFSARDVQRRASRMNAARFRGRIAPGPIGIGFGALDAYNELDARSKAYKAAGGSGQTTTKDKWRAGVKGLASTLGYSVGASAAPIALAPVPGARVAAFGAGMYTGSKASDYAVKQADKRLTLPMTLLLVLLIGRRSRWQQRIDVFRVLVLQPRAHHLNLVIEQLFVILVVVKELVTKLSRLVLMELRPLLTNMEMIQRH